MRVCIDTNVWISGILFSGKPSKIVSAAFDKKFQTILSKTIIEELEKNLLSKFGFSQKNVKKLISRLLQIADLYEPSGSVKIIKDHKMDNLVLETAFLGGAKYLVTGDKEHLLPLGRFKTVKIVSPSSFLDAIQ